MADRINVGAPGFHVTCAGAPSNGTDCVQTITPSAAPASGAFRLRFEGEETPLLPYNVTAAAMQAALNYLASLTNGVAVGLGGGEYTVTFSGVSVRKWAAPLIEVVHFAEGNVENAATGVKDAGAANVTYTVAATTPGVTATGRLMSTGVLLSDTTNGLLYINTSATANAPTWVKVGTQV